MCGIAGYFKVGEGNWDLNKLSRSLITEIQYRGRSASGYAYTDPKGYVNYFKAPVSAYEFVKTAPVFQRKGPMPDLLILHTRAPTVGSSYDNWNNHPLLSRDSGIALIHNGWLLNQDDLKKRFDLKVEADVDTEVLLRMIEMYLKDAPVNRAIGKAMRKTSGVFACALLSAENPGKLWLWRRGNPLHVAFAEGGKLVVFASEKKDLEPAMRSAGIEGEVFQMREGKLWCGWRDKAGKLAFQWTELPRDKEPDPIVTRRARRSGNVANTTPKSTKKQVKHRAAAIPSKERICTVCGDKFLVFASTVSGDPFDSDFLSCAVCDQAGFKVRKSLHGDVKYPFDPRDKNGNKGIRQCLRCGCWDETVDFICNGCRDELKGKKPAEVVKDGVVMRIIKSIYEGNRNDSTTPQT